MIEFQLPSLGADMDEGTLLEWRVAPGDVVKRGQVVAVVDTSKAAVDVEIWHDGVVGELRVQPGEKVPVGTVLATVLAPGEAAVPVAHTVPAQVATPPAEPTPAQSPAVGAPLPVSVPAAAPGRPRQPVSPVARRRASELGVALDGLVGTGAQGAVTLADVEAAAAVRGPETVVSSATPAADRQREMRRAIAAAMSRSKREIPHYYLSETIPMAAALAWLQARNAALPITERVLPAALLLKAVALALRRTPELNGLYREDQFQRSEAVHAGVAISLRGGGLVAPAIHDVAGKPLAPLMRDLSDLVRRARAGSLRSSEMSDPTITVTNLGEQGVQQVFGVIYPPQVALVGFGGIVQRPWVQDGALQVQPVVCATLAADHRVSDGHRGAVFLLALSELLQQPQALDLSPGASPAQQGALS